MSENLVSETGAVATSEPIDSPELGVGLEGEERERIGDLFVSLLEVVDEYAIVFDREGRIHWANASFRASFPECSVDSNFQKRLNDASRSAFMKLLETFTSGGASLELHHPAPGGVQVVSYNFIAAGDHIAALGVDRSGEMEVVTQMAVLIEDLEKEVNHRIALAQRLEELAITDGLTGLFNRRHFDNILRQEWNRWERYGSRFGLLLLDIDRFKRVNDTYGHPVGDEVLRRLSSVLNDVVRCEDMVARYGGEEFAVIAIGAGPEASVELASRLMDRIRSTRMPAPLDRVTVSLGVATPETLAPCSPDHLLRLADDALYRAKAAGRDRIHLCGQEASTTID